MVGSQDADEGHGRGAHVGALPASTATTVPPLLLPLPLPTCTGEIACEKQSITPLGSWRQHWSGSPSGTDHPAGHAPQPVNGAGGAPASQSHGGHGPLLGQAHAQDEPSSAAVAHTRSPLPSFWQHVPDRM